MRQFQFQFILIAIFVMHVLVFESALGITSQDIKLVMMVNDGGVSPQAGLHLMVQSIKCFLLTNPFSNMQPLNVPPRMPPPSSMYPNLPPSAMQMQAGMYAPFRMNNASNPQQGQGGFVTFRF